MAGLGRKELLGFVFGSLVVCWTPISLFADFAQNREFLITVNNKEAGFSRMKVTQASDGGMHISVDASVELRIIFKYFFNMKSTEHWKDGRLVQMDTEVNDNGKQDKVVAAARADQLVVRKTNGQEKPVQADAWSSSFWRLADPKYHNKNVPVFENYTGDSFTGLLQYVATEAIPVGGQSLNCYHFRLTGGPYPIDLWFDQYYLLVRQEFVKTGQRMVIQLTNVR